MGKKEETHARIVENAARMLRKDGYEGVSVADIMREAGLTHGGFYAHFDSRDALVVEAMEEATRQSAKTLEGVNDLETLVTRYLAEGQVKKPEQGCALAALGTETRRQGPAVKAIATRQVEGLLRLMKKVAPKTGDEEARVLLCAMVGAMVLSRAVDSPTVAKQLREAVTNLAGEE